MRKSKRRYVLLLMVLVVVVPAVLALTVFRQQSATAYHRWRMNAEYNTLFGDPKPAGNGLASYDVTGVDVDAVLERYMHHRQALVDLGILSHLTAHFPHLVSDGSEQQSDARSAFARRMWNRFPGHKHYYLASDGSFETWVPMEDFAGWEDFIDTESDR